MTATTRKIFVDQKPVTERPFWAGLVTLVTLVAIAWPLTWDSRADDDFPLSTYPLWSERTNDTVSVPHAVAVAPDGERWVIPYDVAGRGEVMQAFASAGLLAANPQAAMALCNTLASSALTDGERAAGVEVQLATDTFAAVDYLTDDATEPVTVVHAQCTGSS